MKIAFVGIEKNWEVLEEKKYVENFVKYHLELPWYYSYFGNNDVTVVSNYKKIINSSLRIEDEYGFIKNNEKYNVVIHWRKWNEHLYKKNSVNVINSQDHSYSYEWLLNLRRAVEKNKLYGILCFPHWHKDRLKQEIGIYLQEKIDKVNFIDGFTLGVDTDIYKPAVFKDKHTMLWASDPNRGLPDAIKLFGELLKEDKRFKFHICWPDYVFTHLDFKLKHPNIKIHKNLMNGKKLWSLFNESGFLPYTSAFMEPSSRCHRQAQSSGCVVLYPKNMGTPSDLLKKTKSGVVDDISKWKNIILDYVNDDKKYFNMSYKARKLAVDENWKVQAKRFNEYFEKLV